jgi:zinc transporter
MENRGLEHAYILSEKTGNQKLAVEDVQLWKPDQGVLWLHFDLNHPDTELWIQEKLNLNDIVWDFLLSEETRPRTSILGESLLISLRGVNLNPNSEPEDMVAVRVFADQNRIISATRRNLMSIRDIAEACKKQSGPIGVSDFIATLSDLMINRVSDTIDDMEESLVDIEDQILKDHLTGTRNGLTAIQHKSIYLRRYMGPQRAAMQKLYKVRLPWFDKQSSLEIREITHQLRIYIDDLDEIRDRANLHQEGLSSRMTEQLNGRLYVLSLVTAIFLPLSFLTGLFGINLGGIPGAENRWAFSIFTGSLILLLFIVLVFFKKKRWY